MIIVTDDATSYDLTSLSAVKAELGISGTASDTKLSGYISQASSMIASYCNRVFVLEEVAETFRTRPGTQGLCLSRYPVSELVSVVENDTALSADDYETDNQTGIIERISGGCVVRWPAGKTVVTYSAGFEDIPNDIQRAAIQLVKQLYLSGGRDPMVRSETSDGVGSTDYFSGAGTGLPPDVEGLISQYREPQI